MGASDQVMANFLEVLVELAGRDRQCLAGNPALGEGAWCDGVRGYGESCRWWSRTPPSAPSETIAAPANESLIAAQRFGGTRSPEKNPSDPRTKPVCTSPRRGSRRAPSASDPGQTRHGGQDARAPRSRGSTSRRSRRGRRDRCEGGSRGRGRATSCRCTRDPS